MVLRVLDFSMENYDNTKNNEDDIDKDAGMLLNLSQKSNIFVADQTPTPTRLIKNCEEVGLFEDLRHVNPFEETFRKACEQNISQNPASHACTVITTDEESLHTPQVFPQFDVATADGLGSVQDDITKHTLDTPAALDEINPVNNGIHQSQPNNAGVATKSPLNCLDASKSRNTAKKNMNSMMSVAPSISFLPATAQFLQPQVITVTFPATTPTTPNNTTQPNHFRGGVGGASKSKPLLLPKLDNTAAANNLRKIQVNSSNDNINAIVTTAAAAATTTTTTLTHNEPSSASLTPTSQLPIKERLKAILSQSSKARVQEWPQKSNNNNNNKNNKLNCIKVNDTMERRRAASSRYRHKIRNEQKELKKHNMELQTENDNLRRRIKYLETELTKLQTATNRSPMLALDTNGHNIPAQLQIPASAIHLVMNIPKMTLSYNGTVTDLNTVSLTKDAI